MAAWQEELCTETQGVTNISENNFCQLNESYCRLIIAEFNDSSLAEDWFLLMKLLKDSFHFHIASLVICKKKKKKRC